MWTGAGRTTAIAGCVLGCLASAHAQAIRPLGSDQNDISVYWGQNSYGQSSGPLAQQSLATYCEDPNIDVVPMAFLYQLTTGQGGYPVINLSNVQNNCSMFPGTGLVDCKDVGDDIKTCQQNGKKILISIGGATYTENGFPTSDKAIEAAKQVWATFGPPGQNLTNTTSATQYTKQATAVLRPFGDAVVDGFDFDFESTVTNIVPFAKQLRSLMAADTTRPYFLTAAPQCPYPDAADHEVLDSDVKFDAVWVQFYNNNCGLQSFVHNATNQTTFNFAQWDNWAKTKSANKDVKIYLGVPADTTAASTGYTPITSLKPIIDYAKTFSSFGGVMMWDATQAAANKGFLDGVRSALGQPASGSGEIGSSSKSDGSSQGQGQGQIGSVVATPQSGSPVTTNYASQGFIQARQHHSKRRATHRGGKVRTPRFGYGAQGYIHPDGHRHLHHAGKSTAQLGERRPIRFRA